jgi:radical SAM protein with 4Fe4S-binding SPASM domain
MIGSDFNTMMNNLKTLIHYRDKYKTKNKTASTITIQTTFLETNVSDLPALTELCIELGIDRLKGHHLWTHFPELKELSMRRNKDSILRWNNIVTEVKSIAKNKSEETGRTLKLANIYPLNENNKSILMTESKCPFLTKEAWINWEGRFDPCCAPDNLRQSLGAFGNVKETSFSSIWNSAKYKKLTKEYDTHPLCKSCNMKVSVASTQKD